MSKDSYFYETEVRNRVVKDLERRGFSIIDFDVKIEIGERKLIADVVIYNFSKGKKIPLVVIEIKSPTKNIMSARLQAETYTKALKAPFYAIMDGTPEGEMWFQYDLASGESTKTEYNKVIDEIIVEDSKELIKLNSMDTFEEIVWKCYNIIRNEPLSFNERFEEFLKILLAKLVDEKEVQDGEKESYQFIQKDLKLIKILNHLRVD